MMEMFGGTCAAAQSLQGASAATDDVDVHDSFFSDLTVLIPNIS